MSNDQKIAIIIGAGPAGLTAAYELLTKTKIRPIIIEQDDCLGGISRTVEYKGNRMDIGGHRFFSKSEKVLDFWNKIMPLAENEKQVNDKMLTRPRLSRIYFLRKFFPYPVTLSVEVIKNLGWRRIVKIGFDYCLAVVFPIKPETNLEQFYINRFGKELYKTFFADYSKKVWGVTCDKISAEWGSQRVKGLSIFKTIIHLIKKAFIKNNDVKQKKTETSLIEKFLYPPLGPGQMWENVGKQVTALGGEIFLNKKVKSILVDNKIVKQIEIVDTKTGQSTSLSADYVFSSMPIIDLIPALQTQVPEEVKEVSAGLEYRDFIAVGLLVKELKVKDKNDGGLIKDTWLYIQEPEVDLVRVQVFNNWSSYLVKDQKTVWLGLEYICNQTDSIWQKTDEEIVKYSINELAKIDIIKTNDVLDFKVVKMLKTYPAYFGAYKDFNIIRNYLDGFENLFLIGRNGMHKYNNQDHSMLTAITAVDNIVLGKTTKENIWAVNTEQEYHEIKTTKSK